MAPSPTQKPRYLTLLGTAVLGLRSGGSIAPSEVSLALGGRGPLEASCYERHFVQPFGWVDVCKITFVYVDDCRDAIKVSPNSLHFISHHSLSFPTNHLVSLSSPDILSFTSFRPIHGLSPHLISRPSLLTFTTVFLSQWHLLYEDVRHGRKSNLARSKAPRPRKATHRANVLTKRQRPAQVVRQPAAARRPWLQSWWLSSPSKVSSSVRSREHPTLHGQRDAVQRKPPTFLPSSSGARTASTTLKRGLHQSSFRHGRAPSIYGSPIHPTSARICSSQQRASHRR